MSETTGETAPRSSAGFLCEGPELELILVFRTHDKLIDC